MEKIYDVLVNFKKYAYDFYEWDKVDNIEHIKSIPIFKVSNFCLLDFLNYNLVVDKIFLEKIKNKTEIFYKKNIGIINYACILFTDEVALAFEFDENGKLIGKSKLLFEESDEVINKGSKLELEEINYNVISRYKKNDYYTRNEFKTILSLSKYLEKIYNDKKDDELKYLYFECFNNDEIDFDKAYQELKYYVNNANFNVINKLLMLIKVLKK